MLKRIVGLSIVCNIVCNLYAQKIRINADACKNWPLISNGMINEDGQYVFYSVENKPIGRGTLVIQATKSDWKIDILDGVSALFINNKQIAYKVLDTLFLRILGSEETQHITGVSSFVLYNSGANQYLLFRSNRQSDKLFILNINDNYTQVLDNIEQFKVSDNGITLLYVTKSNQNGVYRLIKTDLSAVEKNNDTIWTGEQDRIGQILFDNESSQVVFSTKNTDPTKGTSFWYYKANYEKAVLLTDETAISTDLSFDDIISFDKEGKGVFFYLKEKEHPPIIRTMNSLKVWSFQDSTLQSYQTTHASSQKFVGWINVMNKRVFRIEHENEMLENLPKRTEVGDDEVLMLSIDRKWESKVDPNEQTWNVASHRQVYLAFTSLEKRVRVKELEGIEKQNRTISPNGRFVVFYNSKQKCFFSYEISTGVTRNITKTISPNWLPFGELRPEFKNFGSYKPAGWEGNNFVYLYDQFDIWLVDLLGKVAPRNVTNGYGTKHNIQFRFLNSGSNQTIVTDSNIFLLAYNRTTKENGFFQKKLAESGDPTRLSLGPFIYYLPEIRADIRGSSPIKAKCVNAFLVQRMSSTESPNYFFTNDFKSFEQLSWIHPEKQFSWYNTELITLQIKSNKNLQGVLFKPENIQKERKYPMIVYCYETLSDLLNAFIKPEALSNGCSINISSLVSQGYLVFCPDIEYKIKEPGESALRCVSALIDVVCKKSYVDPKRIGIQGCSFGSFEVNYIVTHTKIFAAACSASGISDLVSHYGSIDPETGSTNQSQFESGQFRIGNNLWHIPQKYIYNSPVFFSNKMNTPLLIMHTTHDTRCPFGNALEFFTALRRLQKPSWLLQYDEGDHGIYGQEASDFAKRMLQFFDHYLKDSACPRWMLYGIRASQKGIDDGLELVREKDPKTGKWLTPPEGGLLTDEEKKKVEKLKHRKPITITLE